jgi:predicted patatin/cPLA2 family phospholipase
MKNKFVLYIGGGAMSGVYSAGVLKGLSDLSLDNYIEAIYGGSAGCLNAAYFLSGQREMGSTIYWDDLRHNFIFPKNVFWGTLDLFIDRFFKRLKPNEVRNAVDIDYVYRVIRYAKPLDIKSISANPTPFFIKLLNTATGALEYKKFQDAPSHELLKAAINIKPYYFAETIVDGTHYIDGTIKEPIGLPFLLKKYPDKKIILVLNNPIRWGLKQYVKGFFEAIVSSLYPYKISLFKLFINRPGDFNKDIRLALQNQNVLILHPNSKERALPATTDPRLLQETFNLGLTDARKIKAFMQM